MAYNSVIRAEDPQALNLLKENLKGFESRREYMQNVNDYFRDNGTMQGFEGMDEQTVAELNERVEAYEQDAPYPGRFFNDNYRQISETQRNIYRLENKPETMFRGWRFEGGEAVINLANNRLQLMFEDKPTDKEREVLKKSGFHWAPSAKVWQRPVDRMAIAAADKIDFLRPLSGVSVKDLQPKVQQKNAPER